MVYSFPRIAVTKDHTWMACNNRSLLSDYPGGRKSKIKMLARFILPNRCSLGAKHTVQWGEQGWISAPIHLFSWGLQAGSYCKRGGKEWLDSESIFKVEPPGYADGLNMTCGRERNWGYLQGFSSEKQEWSGQSQKQKSGEGWVCLETPVSGWVGGRGGRTTGSSRFLPTMENPPR